MNFHAWATKWKIPQVAIEDFYNDTTLAAAFGEVGQSEGRVQQAVRVEAGRHGMPVMRNNVGAFKDEDGRWIRYGLMNDSKRMNEEYKSSDLIGIYPHEVGVNDIGKTLGLFVALEVKSGDWRGVSNERERAQLNFLTMVRRFGGKAGFINSPSQLTGVLHDAG